MLWWQGTLIFCSSSPLQLDVKNFMRNHYYVDQNLILFFTVIVITQNRLRAKGLLVRRVKELKSLLSSRGQKRNRCAWKMNLFTPMAELWNYDSRNLWFIFWAALWPSIRHDGFSTLDYSFYLFVCNRGVVADL